MQAPRYRFVTHWRVLGTPDEVFRVLQEPLDYPRWWPSVYLAVREVEPPGPDGLGRLVALVTRGWLPYELVWLLRVVDADRPTALTVEATGDLTGRGVWTLEPEGAWTRVRFEWSVEARKPLLRVLSPLFRPMLAANHRWAMARGGESLARELVRRRAASPSEADRLAPPPGPARHSALVLAAAAAGAAAFVLAVLRARAARRALRRKVFCR